MPTVILRFDVDMREVDAELERLQRPPVAALESVLATTFAITEARVHVITGKLKASGHPSSAFDGDIWEGTLHFERYPGIFELARGPKHTKGGKGPPPWPPHGGLGDSHFFFDPVERRYPSDWESGDSFQMYTRVIESFLEG
jgi:hypothetical protein